MTIFEQSKYRELFIEIAKIIGFGVLSLLLSKVEFVVPGAVSDVSDLREPALIISVFYLRHWISIAFVVAITAMGIPPEASYVATFSMHFVGLSGLYLFNKYLYPRIHKKISLIGIWALVGVGYFYVFLLPLMTVFHLFLGKIEYSEIGDKFFQLAIELKFEVVLTILVTGVYLLYLKTTELLEKRNDDLFQSMMKAEESDRLKTAFLQNLSHEIRTPMNGIQGFSRLLMANYESPEQAIQYCKHVLQCGDNLLNIVNDIIDISQIETKQLKTIYSTQKISELVNNVLSTVEASGNYNMSRVELVYNECEQVSIKSDLYKIERILYHLVENALKFSGQLAVKVNCKIEKSLLQFTISDSGIGIEDKNKAIIFNKFQQVERELTRAYGGNGLGLSIVDGFIECLNGQIEFESKLSVGTVFTIQIPVVLEK